ncbi:porin family protein [Ancylobacter dichloromethanicus]|uniref:Porin n=1 Tax=Ancylobacter dichloromethanicus TaxID=518825 RepID=A0A9W6MXW6_9HYPH|nr:outer membrane protein [Ancylobacter dichloromethanicus]MBS7553897.1 porin family protein [Ancylobacter dichloromethanicus]GLK71004.1 porin [Ancylobacter dichloromethanicus]
MRIKSLLLGGLAGAALAVPAFAADMAYPVKAAPIAYVPVFTWTGVYLGGNVGYGWGDGSAPWGNYLAYYYGGWDSAALSGGSDPSGWSGGVQIGYNYQLENNVVLGIEADFNFGALEDKLSYTAADGGDPTFQDFGSITSKIEAFGTVRGRVGYAMDRFLPYFTGGLAWANVKVDENWTSYVDGAYIPGLSGTASRSETLWGWTIGGGVEYAVTDNWTVKAEYLYADLGDINWDGAANTKIDMTMQTLKAGVNYKF